MAKRPIVVGVSALVGTRGVPAVMGALVGSVGRRSVHHAPGPALVVQP